MDNKVIQKPQYWLFGSLLFFAAVGLVCSFVLTLEKIHLLQNPDAILSCSVNAWLNCASVMKTWQASLFGFPNSFIGLITYPVIITIAVGKLMGATFPRIFMFLAQIGALLGLIFAYWLFFQSMYVIQVLCPWCLLVTLSTTIIFEALLRYNIQENNLYLPKKLQLVLQNLIQKDYDKLLLAVWTGFMLLLVYLQFRGFAL